MKKLTLLEKLVSSMSGIPIKSLYAEYSVSSSMYDVKKNKRKYDENIFLAPKLWSLLKYISYTNMKRAIVQWW